MDTQNLIRMANKIGDFFEVYPDRAEASLEIVSHLKKFWPPSMRAQLLQHIDIRQGEGLSDVVLSSIRQHRDELEARL